MVSKEYTTRGNMLIVSDDAEANGTLVTALRNSEYFCTLTSNAPDTLSTLSALVYDVVLIDNALTGENNSELPKIVRTKYPNTAIILITNKGNIKGAATAMESGASDYVIKPFDITEVMARIECAILRNSANGKEVTTCQTTKGELVVDRKSIRMTLAGKEIKLTDTEFRLLLELVQNAGKVLKYDELLTRVWGRVYRGERGYLYDYVNHLRNQIELDPHHPMHIITVPRVGYRFDCVP